MSHPTETPGPDRSPAKSPLAVTLGLLIGAVILGAIVISTKNRRAGPPADDSFTANPVSPKPADVISHRDPAAIRANVVHFCGACHAVPNPDYFSKDAWDGEVKLGFDFYVKSLRSDLKVPPIAEVVSYFTSLAPETLELPTSADSTAGHQLQFLKIPSNAPAQLEGAERSGVSHLKFVDFGKDRGAVLLATDMGSGGVWSQACQGHAIPEVRSRLENPAHVEVCDLDQDGLMDLVVADLGSFSPQDHNRGRVVWIRQIGEAPFWSVIPIQEQLGRVADVQSADFDGDDDLDLVVAEFGWRFTGRILLLENQGFDGDKAKFVSHVLDERHGTIHVPVVDLNGDGQLDFVALISQEHEVIVAFLNRGGLKFQPELIGKQRDPAFGSSGIQLVDLDRDGDVDVLYSNGDTFDSHQLKPYHGIHWLENQGKYPFADRQLAAMPGVHRALAGDLDQDGDLDIAAVAALSPRLLDDHRAETLDSVIWLEQIGLGEFVYHRLERGDCSHATMELADFNGDGRLDLAIGNLRRSRQAPSFVLWQNQGTDHSEKP